MYIIEMMIFTKRINQIVAFKYDCFVDVLYIPLLLS